MKAIECLRSIAESLYGIHKELIKLNQTHPSKQAKPEEKEKQFKPDNFIQFYAQNVLMALKACMEIRADGL